MDAGGQSGAAGHARAARARPEAALGLAYIAYFGFLGVTTPFLPLWLAARGLDTPWIAAVEAAVIVAATVGQCALPYGALLMGARPMAAVAAAGATIATAALAVTGTGPSTLLAVAALAGLFTGAMIPLCDALAIAGPGADYGRVRAVGSIGFAGCSVAAGWAIDRGGARVVVPIEAALLALALLGILLVRRASAPVAAPKRRSTARLRATLRRADLWLLILAVATINAGHAYYYLFANLHWATRLGYDGTTTGLLWAAGVVAEIAVFTFAGRRRGLRWAIALIVAGSLGGIARWSLTALDPPLAVQFALQSLHGLTFGATLLGGVQALRLIVDAEVAPAVLGVFAAMVHGVVIGAVTMILGGRYDVDGPGGLLLMAGVSAAGGVLAIGFALSVRGQRASTSGLARLRT